LAEQLAVYQLRYGDWRELFNQLKRIDAVTKADIRRVANKTFVAGNRTYAMVEFEAPKGQDSQQPQGGAQ
jgi:predicted Zn-dependent peptidase